MNRVLRRVARQLRYRPLPELIGTNVTIESVNAVPDAITAAMAKSLPLSLRFIGPEERWITVALAKYCHLDLTFSVDGVAWLPSDNPGMSALKEFGFAVHLDEVPEDQREYMLQDEDPTCLNELGETMDQHQAVLRLFLEEQPRRDLTEYWKELMVAGKGHLFDGGVPEMRKVLDGFFPHQMTVADACLTNAPSIWFHKHFYL